MKHILKGNINGDMLGWVDDKYFNHLFTVLFSADMPNNYLVAFHDLFHISILYTKRIQRSLLFSSIIKSYPAVSSKNIPSRSNCINNSPPDKYSNIKYNFPPV